MNGLTKKQRLANVFAGEPVDHTPVLGGWSTCPVPGVSPDDDPNPVTLRSDGIPMVRRGESVWHGEHCYGNFFIGRSLKNRHA